VEMDSHLTTGAIVTMILMSQNMPAKKSIASW
jgi:hypothetical protein